MFASRPSDLPQQTTSLISNKKIDDVMNIVKCLEESGLMEEGGSKTFKNQGREQKGRFLSMLLRALGAALLGNLLTCEWVKAKIFQEEVLRAGERRLEQTRIFNAASSSN